jgi:IMP dehydrogenase
MSPNGISNGDGNGSPAHPTSVLPHADALAALAEYTRGDGLSVAELMDSRKNGGLTYNDFLMLPGHISFSANAVSLQTR